MSSGLGYLLRPFVTLVVWEIHQTSISTPSGSRYGRYLSAVCRHIQSKFDMNSILNLVRKKSRPAEVRGLSCLSLFSIGIKVSNAVQESVILALTVAQTSLSIWSRSIFFVEPIHNVIFIKSQKGHYHLKKMKFVVYRSWKGTLSGRMNFIYTVLCLVYSISWDVRFNDKPHTCYQ